MGLFGIGLKKKDKKESNDDKDQWYIDENGQLVKLGTGYAQQGADAIQKAKEEREKTLDETSK